jgi:SH3 domain-containing YSC84-like protein 1
MNTKGYFNWIGYLGLAMVLSFAPPFGPSASVADDGSNTGQLVEKARLTLDDFVADPKMAAFGDLLKRAKGVFIAPQVLKGAFVVGVSGGSGVLLVRHASTGEWCGPAFYTLGEVSFGAQIGGEVSEVVLLAMTERGVIAFLHNSLKLGVNAGIALGPVGVGVSAATANLSADILIFSRSKGLYGGVALDGAVVLSRGDWNREYYGQTASPSDIFIRRAVSNGQASELISEVARRTCC